MKFEPVLTKPIKGANMSVEFEHMCVQNRFLTFGDLLIYDTNELLGKPGFDYRMLVELFHFLTAIDKKHLLKD